MSPQTRHWNDNLLFMYVIWMEMGCSCHIVHEVICNYDWHMWGHVCCQWWGIDRYWFVRSF
jgi:hypothetical protein